MDECVFETALKHRREKKSITFIKSHTVTHRRSCDSHARMPIRQKCQIFFFFQKIKSNTIYNTTLLSVHKTYFSQYRLTASLLRSSLRAGSSATKPAFTLTLCLYSKVLHDVCTCDTFHVPVTFPTPPTSTRLSSSRTCRPVSGRPLAPGFLSCNNTCRRHNPNESTFLSAF